MPRTVESIVDNHIEANKRRAAGRPVWDRTIRVKDLLTGESNLEPKEIAEKGKEVVKRIKMSVPKDWYELGDDMDWELEDIINGLDSISEEDDPEEGIFALEEFNGFLDQLYDWADGSRVWIA